MRSSCINCMVHKIFIVRVIKRRRMKWKCHVYKIWVRKPEGWGQAGRPTYRTEDNIKMDVREIGWEVVGWIHLAQVRDQWQAVLNTAMNLWIL